MRLRTIFLCFILVMIYFLIGAEVFIHLEGGKQKYEVSDFTIVFENGTCLGGDELFAFVSRTIEAYKHGVDVLKEDRHKWDFSGAFFFCVTVITTIGYGTIYPVTPEGKIFCIFYALVGIPLCLVMLSGVGEIITIINTKICNKITPSTARKSTKHIIRLVWLFVVGSVIVVFLASIVFSTLEGWNYANSLYFVLITISTIGFGDYIISYDSIVYRVLSGVWIVFGLAWFASIIENIQNIITVSFTKVEAKSEEALARIKETAKSPELNHSDSVKDFNNEEEC